ncbi:MAG: anthranilate synthase component I [Omnitrophica WOR_2 bacterium RBG_13_44_8b]|nr:MAG: anthranilate synthase component I [Omnitrophica WOR_2 bacterium RBG_13_44_8b]
MIYPSLKDFLKLSKKGNVIPVFKEINADLDTPVSCFLKIKQGDYAFLLESVEGQEKIARYSFLGSNPSLIFKSKGRNIEIIYPQKNTNKKFVTVRSPLDEIKKIMSKFKSVSVAGLPRFYGGLVGFIGYDTVRFFENIPDKNPDDLKLPDSIFILTDTILIFDHVNHTIKIISNVILAHDEDLSRAQKAKIYRRAVMKIKSIQADFLRPLRLKERVTKKQIKKTKIASNFKKSEFQGIVSTAKRYIKRGDIIQAVLSQRFKLKIEIAPFEIYRNLRSLNPSPYMYFLKLKDIALIGSSPEMLVRCEDGLIQTRPIAGTRPRGRTEQEDEKLSYELINDKKERAEHLMLVDLGRNDLGRVSSAGKVEVSEFMKIEKYSHVMHLVSEVRGRLDTKKYDIYDVLRAAFPAGTVSGSPKIRAMEIIDELENLRRGPYAGCVGYFSFSHNMDTCITIRTIVVHQGIAYIQAGAGIVADSVPEKEYFESVNKAKALVEAITK